MGHCEHSFLETAIVDNSPGRGTDIFVSMIFESVYAGSASETEEVIAMPYLDTITIVCIGLMIGTEFAVSAFINRALRKLDDVVQLNVIQIFAKMLGTVMPFWYALSLVLLMTEAGLRHSETGFGLLLASAGIWSAVIVLTVLFLVPINNRLARMNSTVVAAQALQEHARWNSLHRVRVAVLGVAMVCFLLAIRA
jgi:uncharacterized membrane protein